MSHIFLNLGVLESHIFIKELQFTWRDEQTHVKMKYIEGQNQKILTHGLMGTRAKNRFLQYLLLVQPVFENTRM